jgi:hypothetical protein
MVCAPRLLVYISHGNSIIQALKLTGTIYSCGSGEVFVARHLSRYSERQLDEKSVRHQLFSPCGCTSSCQLAGLERRQETRARLFVVDFRVMHGSSFLQ